MKKPAAPNLLIVMADQLSPFAVGAYGNPIVKTPHIDALAEQGVVFESAYCNSPLCAPARFTFMSGQQVSTIGAYDNAAYFSSDTPTFAHYLRHLGYQTSLSGKMHFIGSDQLHGFEERLTTDIYPADFGWTPDWRNPDQRIDWWYHNMDTVKQAGVVEISNQLEFDEETGYQAQRKLYDLVRNSDPRPFALTVSFTHPHDPYVTRQRYWNLYRHDDIDLPRTPALPYADMDAHSQRLHHVSNMDHYEITENDIRNARHAYYGNVSYIDEWLGRFLHILDKTGLRDNTIVMVTSDHGDMLGERGMWYKMSFFEGSARVPLIISAPKHFPSRRISDPVSHVDLLPTLVDIAKADQPNFTYPEPIAGQSLLPLLQNEQTTATHDVIGEYMAEGCTSPLLMIRREHYKYIFCENDPAQLYDLDADPEERDNLATKPEFAELAENFRQEVFQRWNPADIKQVVIADQDKRRLLYSALRQGQYTAWDYQPQQDASQRFMRNHLDLNKLEQQARFPKSNR
nr:LOW QUALITY PROTEIN: choline-sulfatase-like [Nerophis lumbriciformis]